MPKVWCKSDQRQVTANVSSRASQETAQRKPDVVLRPKQSGGSLLESQELNRRGLAEGRDEGDQEGRNTAEMGVNQEPEKQRARRDLLMPKPMDTAQAEGEDSADSFILKRLKDKSMLGNHLLDALALGIGVVYGFYGPDMAKIGQSRWQKLSRKLGDLTGLGRSKAGAEKGLVCLYAQQINGSQRLMASRIANGGIQGLAQVELPAGVRVEQAGSQAQVDYSMQQLIAKLSDEDRQAVRSLWVAPELQAQAKLMGTSNQAIHLMQLPLWKQNLQQLDDQDWQEIKRWVTQPNSELTSVAAKALISQRQGELANLMEQGQANVAALFELGLAMTQLAQEEQP